MLFHYTSSTQVSSEDPSQGDEQRDGVALHVQSLSFVLPWCPAELLPLHCEPEGICCKISIRVPSAMAGSWVGVVGVPSEFKCAPFLHSLPSRL